LHPFAWGIGNWFVDSALMLVAMATSFYIWTVAAAVNRKDEVSGGAAALAAMVGWGLLLACAWALCRFVWGWSGNLVAGSPPGDWLAVLGLSTAPGGLVLAADLARGDAPLLAFGLCAAALTHVALAVRYVRRFARISDLEIRSPNAATIGTGALDWLGPPRSTPFMAIAWKQFREAVPSP
jgi:hypothetical protein